GGDRTAAGSRRDDREGEGLQGEGGGDRRRCVERDCARSGARAAAAGPTGEGGACGGSSSERDGGTAREARGTGRAAVDPDRRTGDSPAARSRRGDREGEGLKREGRGDGGRCGERDCAGEVGGAQ